MPPGAMPCVIAVDIGNSRIKLGCFLPPGECNHDSSCEKLPIATPALRLPDTATSLLLPSKHAEFNPIGLRDWLMELPTRSVHWVVASVNRRAGERLRQFAEALKHELESSTFRSISYQDLTLQIDLPEPGRVGIDRLVAAEAANAVRPEGRGVIVIDHGSAITVDVVDGRGAFVGGAILPGLAMAAQALAEQTDALPLVDAVMRGEPAVCGTSTQEAITAGLYWGTRGALAAISQRHALTQPDPPVVLLTGGGAPELTEPLAHDTGLNVRQLPHLVLSGIELIARQLPRE